MSGAPAWVSYAALAVSAISLVVSGLTYRAGGPRLRLQAVSLAKGAANSPFPKGAAVTLTVINAGRAAVTVQGFHVAPYGVRESVPVDVLGPKLPHRLEAHASETWHLDALPVARQYNALIRSGRLRPQAMVSDSQFQFGVAAGNGKTTRDKHVYDALRLIADSHAEP